MHQPLARFIEDAGLIVDEARSPRDVQRIRREIEGREWAAQHGIPTAEIVAKDAEGRWLVSRRLTDAPGESTAYVASAFEVSERIQALPLPRFVTAGGSWRAPRRSMPLRVGRMMRAGIGVRAFLAARRAFEMLPSDRPVHNDYHRHNVLNTTALGHVTVIDWEHAGAGPRYHDMIRLVVTIPDVAVAHLAWRMLLDTVPRRDHSALAVQLRWLALRTYVSSINDSPRESHRPAEHPRRVRWLHALEWADDLTGERGTVR